VKYYTYAHILPDGRYFYIGKGSGSRLHQKIQREKHWHDVADGIKYTAQILARWETEAEAYEHEKLLVACFRDLGHPLVNRGIGGSHSDEAKARWQNTEFRAKMESLNKSRWEDTKYRSLMETNIKNRWKDPEYRARMEALNKARWQDPEFRARMRAIALEREAKKREAKQQAATTSQE